MHENRTLYNALHRVHHLASYPTPLDSGTEGPAEFALTAAGFSLFFVVPDWLFCLLVIKGSAEFFWAHLSTDWGGAGFHFHVEHHRTPTVNYGLATPHCDRRFGTASVPWIELKEEHFVPSMVPREK